MSLPQIWHTASVYQIYSGYYISEWVYITQKIHLITEFSYILTYKRKIMRKKHSYVCSFVRKQVTSRMKDANECLSNCIIIMIKVYLIPKNKPKIYPIYNISISSKHWVYSSINKSIRHYFCIDNLAASYNNHNNENKSSYFT